MAGQLCYIFFAVDQSSNLVHIIYSALQISFEMVSLSKILKSFEKKFFFTEINLMKTYTKKRIAEILVLADSYERFGEFLKIRDHCKRKNYWYALRYAYEHSDDLFKHKNEVKEAFLKDEPFVQSIMNKDEKSFLNGLPSIITIYRGMTLKEYHSKDFGLSWSLSPEKAVFFAYKYSRNHATKKSCYQKYA